MVFLRSRVCVFVCVLQRLVAEKDAELAHGYKLLEASAAERSRLRHSYQAAQEKAKKLQLQLAEAEAKALPVSAMLASVASTLARSMLQKPASNTCSMLLSQAGGWSLAACCGVAKLVCICVYA